MKVSHTEKLLYRTNHLTSTLFAVDEDGVVALHMMYDEWGNPQVDTEFNINKSGVSNLNNYTGYTYDDVLGIYYAQNRFYDASTKRFIQEDPIKDGMNWYAYVGNNPINMIDPWGLFRDGDILGYDYGVYKADNVLLQKKLSEMNLYHGAIDGMFGKETERAVNDFLTMSRESENHFDYINGKVNTATWEALGLHLSVAPSPNIPAPEAIIGTGDDKKSVSYLLWTESMFIDRVWDYDAGKWIFYSSPMVDVWGQRDAYIRALTDAYGYAPIVIDYNGWATDDFVSWWNGINQPVDAIVMYGHGYYGGFQLSFDFYTGHSTSGINIRDMHLLEPKEIGLLLLAACNTAQLRIDEKNLAQEFAKYIEHGNVVGTDGSYYTFFFGLHDIIISGLSALSKPLPQGYVQVFICEDGLEKEYVLYEPNTENWQEIIGMKSTYDTFFWILDKVEQNRS